MPRNRLLVSCALTLLALALPASAQAQTVDVPAAGRGCDEARVGPEEKMLVFSETDGVPARLDPGRPRRDLRGGGRRRDRRRLDRGLGGLHRRDARPVRRGRLPLHHRRPARRRPAGRVRGLHPQGRRLRRHPRGVRHRVRLGVVRRPGRRLLRRAIPPIQDATVEVSDRKHPSTARPAAALAAARTSGTRSAPTRAATCTSSRRWRRRATTPARRHGRRPSDRLVPELRRRAIVVHGRRPHERSPTAKTRSGGTCSAASSGRPNLVAGECGGTEWGNFERVTLAKGAEETGEPIGLAVLPDRSVLHTSRDGTVRYTDATGATKVAAHDPRLQPRRGRAAGDHARPRLRRQPLGLRLLRPAAEHAGGDAPFDGTPEQFAAFKGVNRLSRFKWDPAAQELDLAQRAEAARGRPGPRHLLPQRRRLRVGRRRQPVPVDRRRHEPVRVAGLGADRRARRRATRRSTPSAARPTRTTCAARSCASSPHPATATLQRPARATCSRPARPARGPRSTRWASATRSGSPSTRETGHVYVGDYGPDGRAPTRPAARTARSSSASCAGPATTAGPTASATTSAYVDYDFATGASGAPFDCAAPVNESPRNTGARRLPRAARARTSGTAPTARGRRRCGPASRSPRWPARSTTTTPRNPSDDQVPRLLRRPLVPVRVGARLDQGDRARRARRSARGRPPSSTTTRSSWQNPMDMEFGPEGSLYVLDYGSNWFGGGPDSALYRVDYVKGGRRPLVETSAATGHEQRGDARPCSSRARARATRTAIRSPTSGTSATARRPRPSPTRATPTARSAPTGRR